MFGRAIKLFTIFGFEVRMDLSWTIILVLVVWSLAGGVFPTQYAGYSQTTYWIMGLAGAAGLFVSIVFHEMWHSIIAQRYGLPMKGITLFLFGGVAEMSDEPPSPKAEFLMAIAGPISSVVLGLAFLGLGLLAGAVGWPTPVAGVLIWLAVLNGILVAFNLIPGFPLDGGRVLRSILWHVKGNLRWATRVASQVGAIFGLVLIGLGVLNLLAGANPIGGLWWILIGMFIRSAAKQGYQQVLIRQALAGEPVRRFMNDQPVAVSPAMPLSSLVEDYVYRYHFKMFPVVRDDQLVGCVTTRDIREVPREQWDQQTVGDVSHNCSADNTISADEDAMNALQKMNSQKVSRLIVTDNGQLEGILSLKDLLRFLSLKIELEDEPLGRRLSPDGPQP